MQFKLNINGQSRNVEAEPGTPLLWVIRDRLNLTALWFCWAGGRFYCFTRGQKVVNLRRNPSCTVLVDRGHLYPELHGAMIHARGRILEDAAASSVSAPSPASWP